MFTLPSPELPKGFNQVFESAPGLKPQNNNQGSLPEPQVTGASGFLISLQFSEQCPGWQRALFPGFLEARVRLTGALHLSPPAQPALHRRLPPHPSSLSLPLTSLTAGLEPLQLELVCLVSQMLNKHFILQVCLRAS